MRVFGLACSQWFASPFFKSNDVRSNYMKTINNRPSFRDCLFDSRENPAINKFKDMALWGYVNIPDFGSLEGWRMTLLRLFGIGYALSLLSWLIQEGITIEGIIIRILMMTAFFAVVYLSTILGLVWGFLAKWETFK